MLLKYKIKMAKNELKTKEWKSLLVEVPLENGVTGKVEDSILTITGPKGEVSKHLRYPRVSIEVIDNVVKIGTTKYSRNQKKIIFTFQAHVNNMIRGVTQGFEYELAAVYEKFPLTIAVEGTDFVVKNFLGMKVPRKAPISSDVEVKVNGSTITVTGIDKEKTGQMAASIERTTRISHLDRRVIQDGIYITKKPQKEYN